MVCSGFKGSGEYIHTQNVYYYFLLLGLEPSNYKKPRFGHKSGSTTSITKSSVFHFPSIPLPSSSSTLSEQQQQRQHVNDVHSCYSHKKKKIPITTKKKKKKNDDGDASCSNTSSSSTLSSLSSSLLSSDQNIITHSDSNDHNNNNNNTALESTSTCTSTSSLISDDDDADKKFPGKSTLSSNEDNNQWMMVTPAMDALVIASQIPSVKKIHFVDDFDIPPPTLINRDPSTYPLLTGLLSEQLRPYLPRRYRLASEWNLLYSLDQHGASLSTLYHRAMDSGPCIMVLRDDENQVFGAFLNEAIRVDLSYYGTGECFLWKISPPTNNTSSSSLGSASTSPKNHHHHPIPKIKVFPWTGKNEYMIYSTIDCIAIGGGEGKFGLWLNQDLEKGHSEPCATFDNECLSLNSLFNCIDLEIWSFRI
ncbi:TLD-domain-containing protein [Absidia repens]|uniref:Oxidation resistance protein 1 n=1 Tax=Absidia repens TaxID=90262 RepID=A0A1X2IDE6_9FUNG|nr:TLD-domain-containing protein [Absidia repens]